MSLRSTTPRLTCPACSGTLSRETDSLDCSDCGETVPIEDGIPRFPVPGDPTSLPGGFDALSAIYESPLWFQPLYRFLGGPRAPADDREAIADLLEPEGTSVLDVACGTGRFTRHVAAYAESALGIDVSDGMLERARRYAEREQIEHVSFARMSADDLHVPEDSVDRVACCWALHLFPDVRAALSEIERVLSDGGRFAGATLADEYVFRVPGVAFAARRALGARVFEREALRSLLREAGFEVVEFDRRGGALFFAASR